MKVSKCKHCNIEFDISLHQKGWMANHSRWCEKNPKRQHYIDKLALYRTNINQYTKARLEGKSIPVSPLLGRPSKLKGKKLSEKTKQLISEKARSSKHRRLRKGIQEYKGIMMDSSWEIRLAKLLDDQGIKWNRPEPLIYIDINGLSRNYFPDFYLPDYDLYLDPKNPEAARSQKEKIDALNCQYKNIIFLYSIVEIDKFDPVAQLEAREISNL